MTQPPGSRTLQPEEIRLVRICRAAPAEDTGSDAIIHLETLVVLRAKSPSYTSLSYVCGEGEREFIVDGRTRKLYLNLHIALSHLKDESGWLWIDAISIDQENTARSKQVQHMTEIYGNADQVLVWLGPGTEGNESLMQFFEEIGPEALRAGVFDLNESHIIQWPNFAGDERLITIRNSLERLMNRLRSRADAASFSIEEFVDMTRREWFGRAWTLQEHAVAQNVTFVCGNQRVAGTNFSAGIQLCNLWIITRLRQLKKSRWLPWMLLQLALFWLRNGTSLTRALLKQQIPNSRAATMLGERRKLQRKDSQTLLKSYLTRAFTQESNKGLGCQRKSDRVYAFLGMCSDRAEIHSFGIIPNYDLSWTEQYIQVSKYLIMRGHLDILGIRQNPPTGQICLTDQGAVQGLQWPSWAVDWSAALQRPALGYEEERLFNAATQFEKNVHETDARNTLSFRGYRLDILTADLGTIWQPRLGPDPPKFDYAKAHVFLTEIASYVDRSSLPYYAGRKSDAKSRVPIHDLEFSELAQTQRATDTSSRGYDRIKAAAARASTSKSSSGFILYDPALASYISFMEASYGKRPFLSAQGFIGLCPAGAQAGDLLCVLAGMHGPVVLRPVAQDESHGESAAAVAEEQQQQQKYERFTLVGEAYAYGIMDGELWHLQPPLEARRFEIM